MESRYLKYKQKYLNLKGGAVALHSSTNDLSEFGKKKKPNQVQRIHDQFPKISVSDAELLDEQIVYENVQHEIEKENSPFPFSENYTIRVNETLKKYKLTYDILITKNETQVNNIIIALRAHMPYEYIIDIRNNQQILLTSMQIDMTTTVEFIKEYIRHHGTPVNETHILTHGDIIVSNLYDVFFSMQENPTLILRII